MFILCTFITDEDNSKEQLPKTGVEFVKKWKAEESRRTAVGAQNSDSKINVTNSETERGGSTNFPTDKFCAETTGVDTPEKIPTRSKANASSRPVSVSSSRSSAPRPAVASAALAEGGDVEDEDDCLLMMADTMIPCRT